MNIHNVQRLILVLAGLSVVIVAGIAGGSILERNRRAAERQALREALSQARIAADSCKNTLAYENRQFQRFDRYVDSLRTAVRAFEDAERGGVPQAQYDEYLQMFNLYNDSVAVWQERADSLQAREARCRDFVEAHNTLADSIRRGSEGSEGEPAPAPES